MYLKLKGKVISGTGQGAKFINMKEYKKIFANLGMLNPYPGTLNIAITNRFKYREFIKICKPKFSTKEIRTKVKVLGGIIVWEGILAKKDSQKEVRVLILRPLLSKHEENVLEVISPLYLRKYLNLRDGDYVSLNISCY